MYSTITSLCGDIKTNPLPDDEDTNTIAEKFIEFFISKIEKIRDSLEHHPIYEPPTRDINFGLNKIHTVSIREVYKIINKMKTKSCELDPIPTWFLKKYIDFFIEPITEIIKIYQK